MSGTKKTIQLKQLISAGDMSGNLTSPAVNILFLDNVAVQLVWGGTPTGNFSIEVSLNHEEAPDGTVLAAGDWVAIDLSPSPAAIGSADSAFIDMTQLSARWIRVKYTFTSGTGSLNAFLTAKEI